MSKQETREHARLHRDRIDPSSENVEGLTGLFLEHIAPAKDRIITIYWPFGSEIDTRFMIADLIKDGFRIALPVTPSRAEQERRGRALRFQLWDGQGDLVAGEFGTKVPPSGDFVDPDIYLVPLLAFDRKGHRMGYGRGHYDATLENARKNKEILAIGVGYAAQSVLFDLPSEPHDQKLDMVLTPVQLFDFRSSALSS